MLFKRYRSPPLSLLTVAGLIPPSLEVELCDENVRPIWWETDADLIGVTGMHLHRRRLVEIARAFRARGKRVVIGGPSVTSMPEWYREEADVLIRGEAEYIWPRFLRDLVDGHPQPEYHETGQVDLRDSRMPRYDLVRTRDYICADMQTSRGCPFECEFCDIITIYGRKVRKKTIDQSLAEIERLVSLGARRIQIVDDNLIGDRKHAYALLEAIRVFSRGLRCPPVFSCQATVNVAKDRTLLRLMHEAGVRSMFIGIETPRAASLAETHKYQNLRTDLLRDIETVQSHGIIVSMGTIVGFDHDDLGIFDEHVGFANRAKVTLVYPSQLTALPGTPLYIRLRQEGRLLEENPGDTDKQYGGLNFIPNHTFVPKQMTCQQLTEGYLSMLLRLYDPEAYAERLLGELERLNRMQGVGNAGLSFPITCLAFGWLFGWSVCGRYRRATLRVFWRVIPYVLLHGRRVAPFALSRLVVYHHIYRLTQMWKGMRQRETVAAATDFNTAALTPNPATAYTLAPL